MLRNRLLLLSTLSLAGVACDNVGLAFDPSIDPNAPSNEAGESAVQVVPVGGDARDGRPLVREVYPQGSGWPTSVPVVVEFSESINQVSIFPTSQNGVDGRIGVRVRGTGQLLPANYSLLGGGKLLVIRPLTALTNEGVPVYEIVLFPESRDVDGVRFQVSGSEEVLGDFQVNQGESITDGAIVAVFPRDNFDDQPRENEVFVVFDKPANASTLTSANLALAPAGGAPLATDVDTPLTVLGIGDPRVVRITPSGPLAASQRYEFTASESVTFGQDGNLTFNGAVPFSVFDTVGPARPESVALSAAPAGFENRVNATNIETVQLEVTPPADAQPGDKVVARIYGGDAETSPTFDLTFFEGTATVDQPGAPVLVDFSGQLGSATSPSLDEGTLTFTAQMQRGGERSGFIHNEPDVRPALDVTPPKLVSIGAAGVDEDIFTDTEALALYGVATEELSAAALDDAVAPVAGLFGSSDGGRFLLSPVPLGRLAGPGSYSLTLTDASGNTADTTYSGQILQRGVLTGALAGTLVVRAFDEVSLAPVAGATVLVDPSSPAVPAVGQLVATTDQDGRATFSSALAAHTVTVVHPDYDLVSIVDTQAADVGLPLRPTTDATASLSGTLFFEPAAGLTAIVGSTATDDRGVLGVQTDSGDVGTIPETAIQPNRAQIVTAFGGGFEPTATPAYTVSGAQALGLTLTEPTAPPAPASPGGGATVAFALVPVPPIVSPNPATDPSLLAPVQLDLSVAAGLDTSDLIGIGPRVRAVLGLQGFAGQALAGVGVASLSAAAVYDVDVNYSLPMIAGLGPFAPLPWLVVEAEDTGGRVSRTRGLLVPTSQIIFGGAAEPPPSIPTPAGGVFTNPPSINFDDVLDASPVVGGLAWVDVTVTDPSGRAWRVLAPDRDGAGGQDSLQLPDVSAAPDPGLAVGDWAAVVESRVFLSTSGATLDDLVLTERFRQEVTYARSASVTLTVN